MLLRNSLLAIFLFIFHTYFSNNADKVFVNNIIKEEMASFAPILEKTFKFEGGYQNYATDKPNYNSLGQLVGTNRGISAMAYEGYIRRPPTVEDMKAITPEIAKAVYTKMFWNAIRGNDIKSQDVADIIFALYIGKPSKSNQIVKESLIEHGKDITSVKNPYSDEVVKAINDINPEKLFETIKQRTGEYVAGISPQFRAGWVKKINSYEYSGSKKKWILISIIALALLAGGYYAYKKGYHKKILLYVKNNRMFK
jgi:hypothetical protein